MAYRRGPMKGRGRRRFFRRRRGMRATTEQGARWERCNFTFGFLQDVPANGDPASNVIQLVGGNSMIASMNGVGVEAEAVARMLQLPLRDIEVKALVMDVDCFASVVLQPNGALPNYSQETAHVGVAVFTQELNPSTGAPNSIPPYWLSQWPVNQGTTGVDQFTEDRDFATRTHLSRTFTISPMQLTVGPGEAQPIAPWVPPNWNHHTYIKLRINRKLGDKHGLFFGSWTSNPGVTTITFNAIQFLIHGSLWYKMRF